MDPLLSLGGAGAFVTAGGILLWRYVRVILNQQDERLRKLEEENARCNWRVDMLMGIIRRAGLPVPEELWGPPPWSRLDAAHVKESQDGAGS